MSVHNLGSVTTDEREIVVRALLDYVADLASCVTIQYNACQENAHVTLGAVDTAAHAVNVGAAGALLARIAGAVHDEENEARSDSRSA